MEVRSRGQVTLIGAFPPPVHGMALVNAAVEKALNELDAKACVIDISADDLKRSFAGRLSRLPKVLQGLFRLLTISRLKGTALYMSVSGGAGQIYEIMFALIARMRGMRLFLHHHSYAYLDHRSAATKWLSYVAGSEAVHVALSPGMVERLKALYPIGKTTIVSNSAIFLRNSDHKSPKNRDLRTLGFLSNISAEKGVFEFLDLVAAAHKLGLPVAAKLAGPFQDQDMEVAVRSRLSVLTGVEYIGPVYGVDKDKFFSDIDVLVFPSRYKNEAEPLTLHEAMSHGVPIIAYGRGAIREIVGTDCGCVIDPVNSFVPEALQQTDFWMRDSALFRAASVSAAARFDKTHNENLGRWHALLSDILG